MCTYMILLIYVRNISICKPKEISLILLKSNLCSLFKIQKYCLSRNLQVSLEIFLCGNAK